MEENQNAQRRGDIFYDPPIPSHDVVFGDAPIIDVFYYNGKPVNFYCRGDINQIILDMKLLTRRSPTLPATPTAQPADKPTE